MIPPSVLAALGLTVDQIEASAAAALGLQDLWDIAGGAKTPQGRFFAFTNAYVRNIPGTTRQDATIAYRQARYWSNQASALSQLDTDEVIDRRLAATVMRSEDEWRTGQNYRYRVDVTVTFPDGGGSRTFGVYVYRPTPTTSSGAMGQALETIFGQFKSESTPAEFGGGMENADWTSVVAEFVRYQLED